MLQQRGHTSAAPTLVTLHAHPDDEAIYTGGLLLRAATLGWRCVVIVATSGEGGRSPRAAVDIGAHRRAETYAAAKILGVARVEFLGYRDSGMAGDVLPLGALAVAEPAEVVARAQAVLDEDPDLVVSCDLGGDYGHPDHLAVHRLGRGLSFAGALYEATINRVELAVLRERWLGRGMPEAAWPAGLADTLGMDHPGLVRMEVDRHFARKQSAITAHGSQVVEADSFMGLPPGVFSPAPGHRVVLPGPVWRSRGGWPLRGWSGGAGPDGRCSNLAWSKLASSVSVAVLAD
jgi:LmbE family N-acetylglucosaminyl deacetylase